MKKALINSTTKVIDNVIEWEDGSTYVAPAGCELVDYVANAAIGDTLDSGTLTKATVPEEPDPLAAVRTAYEAASTDAAKLAVLAEHLGLTT